MCYTCKYVRDMPKMIQIRHVPDALHRKLKMRAAMQGTSLSEYLMKEIELIADQRFDNVPGHFRITRKGQRNRKSPAFARIAILRRGAHRKGRYLIE